MATIQWSQNTTHVQLPITLTTTAGNALDLTSAAAIAVKLRPDFPGTQYTTLAGQATIISAANGQLAYKFATTDVAVVGNYKLVVMVTFTDGSVWNSLEADFDISQAV